MKRKVVLLLCVILIITILSALASCELLACRIFYPEVYIAIPKNAKNISLQHFINKEEIYYYSQPYTILDTYDYLVEEYPNAKVLNESTNILINSSGEFFGLLSSNVSVEIVLNIDGEEYKGKLNFDYISSSTFYNGISEFKEFTLINSSGNKLYGLYMYRYSVTI